MSPVLAQLMNGCELLNLDDIISGRQYIVFCEWHRRAQLTA